MLRYSTRKSATVNSLVGGMGADVQKKLGALRKSCGKGIEFGEYTLSVPDV